MCKLKKISNKKAGKEPPAARSQPEPEPAAVAEPAANQPKMANGHVAVQERKRGQKKHPGIQPVAGRMQQAGESCAIVLLLIKI